MDAAPPSLPLGRRSFAFRSFVRSLAHLKFPMGTITVIASHKMFADPNFKISMIKTL